MTYQDNITESVSFGNSSKVDKSSSSFSSRIGLLKKLTVTAMAGTALTYAVKGGIGGHSAVDLVAKGTQQIGVHDLNPKCKVWMHNDVNSGHYDTYSPSSLGPNTWMFDWNVVGSRGPVYTCENFCNYCAGGTYHQACQSGILEGAFVCKAYYNGSHPSEDGPFNCKCPGKHTKMEDDDTCKYGPRCLPDDSRLGSYCSICLEGK